LPDVDPLANRPIELLWETGFSPLWAGSGFFLLGIQDLLKRFLPPTSLIQEGISWVAICFTAAAFAAAAIWGKRSIRARVVSPHTGYVEPKSRNWLLLPALFVPLLLVPIIIAYAFTSYGRPPAPYTLDDGKLVVPGFALVFAALSLHYGWKRKVLLLLVYGIYLICLALLIWRMPLTPTERGGLLMSGAGGPLAVFGAIRLRAFLRNSPESVEDRSL
jgi:hypothetical protein